jgi:alpha-L-rhamnosidase
MASRLHGVPVANWTMGLLNKTDWQGGWLVPPTNNSYSLTGCNPGFGIPKAIPQYRLRWEHVISARLFSVRSDSALTGATLLVTADNSYTAYINGTQVGQGQDYTTVAPVGVTAQLQTGTNLLAIAAANSGSSGNPAGLLGMLVLTYADGSQTNIQMDATWKAANVLCRPTGSWRPIMTVPGQTRWCWEVMA